MTLMSFFNIIIVVVVIYQIKQPRGNQWSHTHRICRISTCSGVFSQCGVRTSASVKDLNATFSFHKVSQRCKHSALLCVQHGCRVTDGIKSRICGDRGKTCVQSLLRNQMSHVVGCFVTGLTWNRQGAVWHENQRKMFAVVCHRTRCKNI